MPTRDEIRAVVRELVLGPGRPAEAPADVDDDFDLREGGVLDSLRLVRLVAVVEREFDLQVDADDVDTAFRTVASITSYIATHTGAAS